VEAVVNDSELLESGIAYTARAVEWGCSVPDDLAAQGVTCESTLGDVDIWTPRIWYGSVHFPVGDLQPFEFVRYEVKAVLQCPYDKTLVFNGKVIEVLKTDAWEPNNTDSDEAGASLLCGTKAPGNKVDPVDPTAPNKPNVPNGNGNTGYNPGGSVVSPAATGSRSVVARAAARVTGSKMTRTGVNLSLLTLAISALTTGALTISRRRNR